MLNKIRSACVLGLLVVSFPHVLWCQASTAQAVRFHTNLGDIDVSLLVNSAPKTVANFLNYVNRGDFNNSIIHRSVPGFIFQGGGFQLVNHNPVTINPDPPVVNEYSVSNTRGTLAMAKVGTDPNSATDQWFFNEADNSSNLNNQNGGFTVFGHVANVTSLAVMDKIAAVPVPNPGPFSSPFDQIPLQNYSGGQVTDVEFVVVMSVTPIDVPAPAIAPNGIITASGFGGFSAAAPGSFIEIYGTNLGGETRGWANSDFVNGIAPTSLGGVSVSVNGRPAYVNFVSATQVNVQIPGITPSGGSVPVIVTYQGLATPAAMLAIKPLEAGLLAPATFNVGGKQYVVAVHPATGALVSNGKVAGIPAAPAAPGETLVFYGVGFGQVSPSSVPIAGQVVRAPSALTTPVQFNIGQTSALITYAGLTQGLVGVYQFNVTVPTDAANGDLPLEVVLGGQTLPQTLFLPVQATAK